MGDLVTHTGPYLLLHQKPNYIFLFTLKTIQEKTGIFDTPKHKNASFKSIKIFTAADSSISYTVKIAHR